MVTDYVGAMRARGEELKGSPLRALGVPANAVKDPIVNKSAQNLLKSVVFFIVAQEYAPVMYHTRVTTRFRPSRHSNRKQRQAHLRWM